MTRRDRPERSTRKPLPHVTKHARDRMIEHYGRDLEPAEWADVVRQILSGRAVLCSRHEAGGSEIYSVRAAGWNADMRVAWRFESQTVATVLDYGDKNYLRVAISAAKPVRRPGMTLPSHFKGGKRLPRTTRWRDDADPGRGPRGNLIDMADDE